MAEALATIETLAVERMHLADVRALDGYDVACDRLLAALARGFPALRVLELGGRMPVDRVERLRRALQGRVEVLA